MYSGCAVIQGHLVVSPPKNTIQHMSRNCKFPALFNDIAHVLCNNRLKIYAMMLLVECHFVSVLSDDPHTVVTYCRQILNNRFSLSLIEKGNDLCCSAGPTMLFCYWTVRRPCWPSFLWTAPLPWCASSRPALQSRTSSSWPRTQIWPYYRSSDASIQLQSR